MEEFLPVEEIQPTNCCRGYFNDAWRVDQVRVTAKEWLKQTVSKSFNSLGRRTVSMSVAVSRCFFVIRPRCSFCTRQRPVTSTIKSVVFHVSFLSLLGSHTVSVRAFCSDRRVYRLSVYPASYLDNCEI